ncbi:MAG TPA: DUF4331 domain-containing protein [Candidatus Polarisedimenticolia bacterium]|jgi:hypothetical protein
MKRSIRFAQGLAAVCLLAASGAAMASSHREAPLTAIDRTADITDFYAFVSYDDPGRVTMIMGVDPFLEPANGPNYFPFDESILYAIKVDNDNDALEDVSFEFRFITELRLPGVPVGFAGAGAGVPAPLNSPAPVPPGAPIIPPAITALDGPGSEGLGLRQRYTVTMILGHGEGAKRIPLTNPEGRTLYAVPSNVGPRTMPAYAGLVDQGIFPLERGVKAFAGTTDDAFWIDLGAAFDSLNFRVIPTVDVDGNGGYTSTGIPAVMSADQDAAQVNFVSDSVSGYNVNHIAVEVPITLLTKTGTLLPMNHPNATIGTWSTTSRQAITLRRTAQSDKSSGPWKQVQRMGNPLFNELLIGTDMKDEWSRSRPKDDARFAGYALDPLVARIANAAYGGALTIPEVPRLDLLPVVFYMPPIAAPGTPQGPVADLLRLNTGVAPTPYSGQSRLGVLGGDPAGFPNGRRVGDDVTDIVLRLVVGGVLAADKNGVSLDRFPNNRLGDGVNVNDIPYLTSFPYVGYAHDGVNRRHLDPAEPGGGPANP